MLWIYTTLKTDAASSEDLTLKSMRGLITYRCGGRVPSPPAVSTPQHLPFSIVAISPSLGGIAALGGLLGDVLAGFPLPILVCQHVRRGWPSLLPAVLAPRTALRLAAAREGDLPTAGCVRVAPPDRHPVVRPDGGLGLEHGEPINFCRPAADTLFRSVAEAHGPRAIAVVLTGRGCDSALGIQAVRARVGLAIAQDEDSSAAFDMPLAARDIGQADLVLPLGRIATALRLLASDEEGAARPSRPRGRAVEAGGRHA